MTVKQKTENNKHQIILSIILSGRIEKGSCSVINQTGIMKCRSEKVCSGVISTSSECSRVVEICRISPCPFRAELLISEINDEMNLVIAPKFDTAEKFRNDHFLAFERSFVEL